MRKFNEISNTNLNLTDDLKRMEVEMMDLKILVLLSILYSTFNFYSIER